MTDAIVKAHPLYRAAWAKPHKAGPAFEIYERKRSGWWIFWACALLVLAAITLGGM